MGNEIVEMFNTSGLVDVVRSICFAVSTGLVANGVAPHLFKVSLKVGTLDL